MSQQRKFPNLRYVRAISPNLMLAKEARRTDGMQCFSEILVGNACSIQVSVQLFTC